MNHLVWLNGVFLTATEASISPFDRSWMYGDGLFETVRIHNGHPFRWSNHWNRWTTGAHLLRLHFPFSEAEVRSALEALIKSNQIVHGIARLHLSRGAGKRGYSIQDARSPVLLISASPAEPPSEGLSFTLSISTIRLPVGDPLGKFKTASKLPFIVAQIEAEETGASAALLTDTEGVMATSTRGNLFWLDDADTVMTPPLSTGALDGVTRTVIIEMCRELEVRLIEAKHPPSTLFDQAGVFISGSGFGLAPVTALDKRPLPSTPLLHRLQLQYRLRLERGE